MQSGKSTPLPADRQIRQEVQIAGLVIIGLLMFLFESLIPRPLPWFKIGLANIATLLALYWMGWRAALSVAILRIFIGAVFTGSLFTPGFFLSFGGGISALLAMGLLYSLRLPGILTVSAAGGIAHNLGQLLVAQYILFQNPLLWYLVLPLILLGLISGSLTGLFSYFLLRKFSTVQIPLYS